MDFSFSQEQELLRKTARDFLQRECPTDLVRRMEEDDRGYPTDLWRKIAELGWLGLPFPIATGGAGGTFLDLAALLEEVGRALAPAPIFSTVVLGGLPIAEFGTDEQRAFFLPAIASGDAILSFGMLEHRGSYRPEGIRLTATHDGDGFRLNGTKIFVENAHIADHLLVSARMWSGGGDGAGVTVFIVDPKAPGVTLEPLRPLSLEKQWEVTFDGVKVTEEQALGTVGAGWPVVQRTLEWAVAAQCAQAVGGAQAVLEMAVEYAKGRVQFQRPIGSFQAIQHHAADMYSDVETMRLITYELAWLVSEGRPCAEELAVAKTWVSSAYTRMTRMGIQIYGGIGMAKEMDPQLYFRRAKAWEPLFGGPDEHRAVLAETIGAETIGADTRNGDGPGLSA